MTSLEKAIQAATKELDERKIDGRDDYYAQVSGLAAGAVKAALATGEIHAADECLNIAAAPDLLAAAKALLADDTHYVPLPYRDDLEAAIAKAEGRE